MNNEMVFGRWEGTCLLITMIATKAVLGFPRVMMESAGVAGWILSAYISFLALIGFWIINKLYKGFPGKDILDIGESLGGKPVKIITGTVIWVYLTFMMITSLRLFGELIKSMGFPTTPPSFLMLFFFCGSFFCCLYRNRVHRKIHGNTCTCLCGKLFNIYICTGTFRRYKQYFSLAWQRGL